VISWIGNLGAALGEAIPPAPEPPVPTIPSFQGEAGEILGFLAWCASAAGIVGLIAVGMSMAIQLRRGEPGEGGAFFRQIVFVVIACIVAVTAGPIVNFVGLFKLEPYTP
jgi:hypothetical protein